MFLGFRIIANSANGPVKILPLPPKTVFQIALIACMLVIALPIHLAFAQFYFDAVMTLKPGH
jgi:hypothetical protein